MNEHTEHCYCWACFRHTWGQIVTIWAIILTMIGVPLFIISLIFSRFKP